MVLFLLITLILPYDTFILPLRLSSIDKIRSQSACMGKTIGESVTKKWQKADLCNPSISFAHLKELQIMNKTILIPDFIQDWLGSVKNMPFQSSIASKMIKAAFRCRSEKLVNDIIENYLNINNSSCHLELAIPILCDAVVGFGNWRKYDRCFDILSLLQTFNFKLDVFRSKQILQILLKDLTMSTHEWNLGIQKCIHAILSMPGFTLSSECIQIFTAKFSRHVQFVKGVVSFEGLPKEGIPEVAFVGRSNVGKSSLVNLVLNRKGLAFSSRTPGKTSVSAKPS